MTGLDLKHRWLFGDGPLGAEPWGREYLESPAIGLNIA
jgi:hypothetical protein